MKKSEPDYRLTTTWAGGLPPPGSPLSANSGYTYNNLNMMTASPGHSYEHDILGNRTWRNPFSSTTVECVWDDAGRMTRTYDAPHFPLYDGHGNMTATLSRTTSSPYHEIANVRTYDVRGGVRSGASSGDPNTRYCANLGHKQDDESGLIYMRARYYEPAAGRFVSEDPAMAGKNWYVYCSSMPTHYSDFTGRFQGSTMTVDFYSWALRQFEKWGIHLPELPRSAQIVANTIATVLMFEEAAHLMDMTASFARGAAVTTVSLMGGPLAWVPGMFALAMYGATFASILCRVIAVITFFECALYLYIDWIDNQDLG